MENYFELSRFKITLLNNVIKVSPALIVGCALGHSILYFIIINMINMANPSQIDFINMEYFWILMYEIYNNKYGGCVCIYIRSTILIWNIR